MSVPLLPSFLAVSSRAFSTCFSRFLFLSAILLSPSVSSFSFLLLPLFFPNVADALAVAPALCAPARVARAMASDFHANVNVAAGVVSGTLTACGSTPLAVWEGFAKEAWKRRQGLRAALSLEHLPRGALGLRLCVLSLSRSLALALALTLALALALSLCNLSYCPSARTHAHFLPSHLSHALSPSSPSSSSSSSSSPSPPLCLIFFLFVLPPLLLLLRFFFFVVVFFSIVSASANPCWLKPPWLPAQLLGTKD